MNEYEQYSLGLIRQLYREGSRLSEGPWPSAAFSILAFHDAAEWFLHLAANHLGVGMSNSAGFLDYFEGIANRSPLQLSQKAQMQRLNGARREMKHRANLPDRSQIPGHREATYAFLSENTREIFGISMLDVSLVSLVQEPMRKELVSAEEALAAGQLRAAAEAAAVALELLLRRLRVPGLRRLSSIQASTRDLQLAQAVTEQFAEVHAILELLLLGIDYNEYSRFMASAPSVSITMSGKRYVTWIHGTGEDLEPSDVDFMIDFAARLALSHIHTPREPDGHRPRRS